MPLHKLGASFFVLAAFVAFIAYVASSRINSLPTTLESRDYNSVLDAGLEWTLFRNERLGFEFEYPADWSVTVRDENVKVVSIFIREENTPQRSLAPGGSVPASRGGSTLASVKDTISAMIIVANAGPASEVYSKLQVASFDEWVELVDETQPKATERKVYDVLDRRKILLPSGVRGILVSYKPNFESWNAYFEDAFLRYKGTLYSSSIFKSEVESKADIAKFSAIHAHVLSTFRPI